MPNIIIVYHSCYGHTKKVAEAVLADATDAGAQVSLLAVADVDDAWARLDAADAIVFGAPTYRAGRPPTSRSSPMPAPNRGSRRNGRTRSRPASPTPRT